MTLDELSAEVIDLRNELVSSVISLRRELDQLRQLTSTRLDYQTNELSRLENTIDRAFLDAVHELLDYLRHEDIQSLDEEEFAKKVRDLIRAEPELPF